MIKESNHDIRIFCDVCTKLLPKDYGRIMIVWNPGEEVNFIHHTECDDNDRWDYSRHFEDWIGEVYAVSQRTQKRLMDKSLKKIRINPKVPAVKVDDKHVYIKCPYCNDTHVHGSNGGKNYEGHRLSHCTANDKGYDITPEVKL